MGPIFDQEVDDFESDLKPWLGSLLEPGESLLWTGRPDAGALVIRSLPMAAMALGMGLFALLWCYGVVMGGGNWDKGKVVAPFASHNISGVRQENRPNSKKRRVARPGNNDPFKDGNARAGPSGPPFDGLGLCRMVCHDDCEVERLCSAFPEG